MSEALTMRAHLKLRILPLAKVVLVAASLGFTAVARTTDPNETLAWNQARKIARTTPRLPLSWRIGRVDAAHNLTTSEVRAAIQNAINLWEGEAGRNLFNYDERKGFPIHIIFDQRQERENAASRLRKSIQSSDRTLKSIEAEIDSLKETFERARRLCDAEVEEFNARLSEFNRRVRAWNAQGGAPPDVVEQLERERRQLDSMREDLQERQSDLNNLRRGVNARVADYNLQLDRHQSMIREFNTRYAKQETVRLGQCVRNATTVQSVSVFCFRDVEHLTFILAHELGHAIGLGHVEGRDSVMVAVEEGEKASEALRLSANDRRELARILGR